MKPLTGEPFDRIRIPREEFLARLPEDKRIEWLKVNDKVYDGPSNCMFTFTYNGTPMMVVASNGGGWDHISVSAQGRCPTWDEMERVKRLFFRDNEVAFQLHVPPRNHINNHPYTLHLWRPHDATIPLPP